MPEIPLKNQIIAWLKDYDYWLQYACNRLLEGDDVTDDLATATYDLFKEDNNLKLDKLKREDILFNEIAIDTAVSVGQLKLQVIKEIENVNALATGQSIPINSNLTIIYGGNGAGKSGYIRLLNNAFSSRGDKQILQNVFNDKIQGEPACKFTFQSNSHTYDLNYPSQKNHFEFSQFSVFDSHSIKVHLEQDNKLDFTPSGFEFFEKILKLYDLLKIKLEAEIKLNRPINGFDRFFINDNIIRNQIATLGHNSNISELKELGTYSQNDQQQFDLLIAKREELRAFDIPKKIADLQRLSSQFLEFVDRQLLLFEYLKSSEIDNYKSLVDSFHKFRELTKHEGLKILEEYRIENIGSVEWREFIKSSRSYAQEIEKNRNGKVFPSDQDNCLFCLRHLTQQENVLINSYWKLLKSEAEGEFHRIDQSIKEVEKKIKGLFPVKFDETTTLFEYVNSISPELALKWKEYSLKTEKTKRNIILNLANRNFDIPVEAINVAENEYEGITSKLKADIAELYKKNPTTELAELEIQIQFLNDKSLLSKLLDQVFVFIESHKWAKKAEASNSALNTRPITIKQGELFTTHITDNYTNKFIEECKKLNAPLTVNIVQRNAHISTLRKLQVGGVVANSVLSEGEQRVISLSDFLTEVQLNPYNKGVFLDDPVTSQDHLRREYIAERLVELSTDKQVIVFTCDIAFFLRLKLIAELKNIDHVITTIRNVGGTPGIIHPELPWIAQNVKARIGTLKNRLVLLKKIEKEASADDYLIAAKSWYGLLREAWERVVEERLFKGVVERFLLGIQTQRLKNVTVTNELIKEIENGMKVSSSLLHDAAAGLNPTLPDTNKAEKDLKYLEDFAMKCVAS